MPSKFAGTSVLIKLESVLYNTTRVVYSELIFKDTLYFPLALLIPIIRTHLLPVTLRQCVPILLHSVLLSIVVSFEQSKPFVFLL